MAGSMISPGIYNKGPNDTLIEKDVYREDVLESANNYQVTDPAMTSATDFVKDLNVSASDITGGIAKSVKATSTGLKLDSGSLKKQLEKALKIPGSLNDIKDAQKNILLKGLEDATGLKGLKTVINGTTAAIKGMDSLTAGSAIEIINQLAGSNGLLEFLDLDAEAAGLRYFCGLLVDWGVGDLFDDILSKIKDSDTLNELLEELTVQAAKNGNIELTDQLSKKMGHGRAYVIRKEIITALISNYHLAENETRAYGVIGETLLSYFGWLDANWDKDPYDATLTCMTYYILASTDARTVLSYTNRDHYAASSAIMKSRPVEETIKLSFPDLLVF